MTHVALAAKVSKPTYESFESIHVTSGQTPGTVSWASAIRVKSNGSDYTQPVGDKVTYLMGGSAKVSSNKWRVFNVEIGIGAMAIMNNGTRSESVTHFSNFGSFYSIGVNQYATKEFKITDYPVQVPLGTSGLGQFAVQRCNANKKGLQQQGVSNIAIFNQDRTIDIPVSFHFAAQVHDKDKSDYAPIEPIAGAAHGVQTISPNSIYWRQATLWQNVSVVCEKSPDLPVASPKDPTPIPDGPDKLKIAAGVTQSFVTLLTNVTPNGACGVKLSGVIETNLPNISVTFAYRNHKGVETPTRTVKTDHTKTVMFVDEIDFSKGKNGGGIVFNTPTGSTPAGSEAAAPSDKQFHGWYQIVGKNFVFTSNIAEYSFDCQPKTVGGLKAPAPAPVALPFAGQPAPAPAAQTKFLPPKQINLPSAPVARPAPPAARGMTMHGE